MAIKFEKVGYTYGRETAFSSMGLNDINTVIEKNTFNSVIGHTGSGKTTLLQALDGLIKISTGTISLKNMVINVNSDEKKLFILRKHIGLVFQFSENQLFADTVLKDVMFGPINFGISVDKAKQLAEKWLRFVGIGSELFDKSPFDLSGGQMKRVAIAGVLAFEPDILCLDEPVSSLDPQGRKLIMQLFKKYQQDGHTVILVSHNMDEVYNYSDNIIVMENGTIIKQGSPRKIFEDKNWLDKHKLVRPSILKFIDDLEKVGFKVTKTNDLSNLLGDILQQIGVK